MPPSLASISMTRQRGPVPNETVETSTSTGRALHALEGVAFTGSAQAVYYRSDRDSRLTHDAQADHHVYEIERAALTLLEWPDLAADVRDIVHGILANVAGYQRADQDEDAAAASGDARVSTMHAGFRWIGSFVERSCVAIREQARQAVRS